MSKKAIVLGGHVQALGIVRILGKADWEVYVVSDTRKNLARHSRYTKDFFLMDTSNLIESLFEHFGTSASGAIILPTNDEYVELLSKNKEILSERFVVGVDDWRAVEIATNKRLTYRCAESLGISIPATWMPDTKAELLDLEISFPVIVKPAIMHSFYKQTRQKVFYCEDKESLMVNYEKALQIIPNDEIIIQTVIPGDSYNLYSACFLFDKDVDLVSFVGRRARQHPPDFGNATTYAEIVDSNELLDLGRRILKNIQYRGVCEVEFKFDESKGEFLFLEINARTWKWHSIAESANRSLLTRYIALLTNENIPKLEGEINYVSFRHIITDVPTLIRYHFLDIARKLPRKPTTYAVWDLHDIKPFIFEIFYLPSFVRNR